MEILPRVFIYNGLELPDPDPELSPEEVKEFYSNMYPAITTAKVVGPETNKNRLEYKITAVVGTKGVEFVLSSLRDIIPDDALVFDSYEFSAITQRGQGEAVPCQLLYISPRR